MALTASDAPADEPVSDKELSENSEMGNPPARKRKKADATKDICGGVWKPQEDGSSDCLICV